MRPIHRSYSVTTSKSDKSHLEKNTKVENPKEEAHRSKLIELISRFNGNSLKRNSEVEKYTSINDENLSVLLNKPSGSVKRLFSKRVTDEIESVLKYDSARKLPDVAKDCFLRPSIGVPTAFKDEPIYDIPKRWDPNADLLKVEDALFDIDGVQSFAKELLHKNVACETATTSEAKIMDKVELYNQLSDSVKSKTKKNYHNLRSCNAEIEVVYKTPKIRSFSTFQESQPNKKLNIGSQNAILAKYNVQSTKTVQKDTEPSNDRKNDIDKNTVFSFLKPKVDESNKEPYFKSDKTKEISGEKLYDILPACRIDFSDFPKFPTFVTSSQVCSLDSVPSINDKSLTLSSSDMKADDHVIEKLQNVMKKFHYAKKESGPSSFEDEIRYKSHENISPFNSSEGNEGMDIKRKNSIHNLNKTGYADISQGSEHEERTQTKNAKKVTVVASSKKNVFNEEVELKTNRQSSHQNLYETENSDTLKRSGHAENVRKQSNFKKATATFKKNSSDGEIELGLSSVSSDLTRLNLLLDDWERKVLTQMNDKNTNIVNCLSYQMVYPPYNAKNMTSSFEKNYPNPTNPLSDIPWMLTKVGEPVDSKQNFNMGKYPANELCDLKSCDIQKPVKPQDEIAHVANLSSVREFWNSRDSGTCNGGKYGLRRTKSLSNSNKRDSAPTGPDVVDGFKEKLYQASLASSIGNDLSRLDSLTNKSKNMVQLDLRKDQNLINAKGNKVVDPNTKQAHKKRVVVKSDSFKVHELKRFWENAKRHNLVPLNNENDEVCSFKSDCSSGEFVSALNSHLVCGVEGTFPANSQSFSHSTSNTCDKISFGSNTVILSDGYNKESLNYDSNSRICKKISVSSGTSGYSSGHDLTESFGPDFSEIEKQFDQIESNDLSINLDNFETGCSFAREAVPPLPLRAATRTKVPERPNHPKPKTHIDEQNRESELPPVKFISSISKSPLFDLKGSSNLQSLASPTTTPAISGDFSTTEPTVLPQKHDVFFKALSQESKVSIKEAKTAYCSTDKDICRDKLEIFFRAGTLSKLESQRDDHITTKITRLQAWSRAYLARKRLERRKVEDTAVRCVQRNVRKLLGVREWPWWRLLIKLSPLLNVHRTEEELRSATDELTTLRSRLDILEKEKTELKMLSSKLEIKVSELTNDLAEEHSTAVLATERLEAETTERLKLEKDVKELQEKLNSITSDHDRLELEVLCSRSTSQYLAASVTSEDFDPEADAAIYKQKYERCCRDLEFMKEKLRAQHEDDLDQMVSIKKQLEKKLNDAYEEVEEQRQVAAQWKRKAQRLVQEGNDTKLLLEEQVNRNAILEKKQRKFDSDMQNYQEEIRQEKSVKEKMQKERDFAILEKEQIEHDLQSVQLELEMRGERLSALQREVESLSADEKSDPEVASLRRSKLELENKVKDQEEELDDLAGQVQLLESAKVRLELQIENMRKDYKRELTSKDDEVEDVRCSAQKKVKAIEAQLEAEHEERTGLVREKHELERRLLELTSELSQSTNDVVLHKLKKELRKLKALLKDAQVQLEQAKSDTPSKVLLRQLRNQLEDAEFAKTTAIKGRQHAEQELQEMQLQYDEVSKLRNDAEDKYLQASRERTNLQTQLDDLDAEMTEIMRKYKSAVQQLSIDQLTIQEQASQIQFLEQEKQSLKESLAELSVKLENMEGETVTTHTQKRLELKIRELESKADLELTSKQRIETQVARLKETIEKSVVELENSRSKEQASQDQVRKLQRQLRELREELSGVNQRDTDASQKVREIEQAMDILEAENEALKRDLNIALRRIDDLQSAMQGDSESHESDAQLSDSDSDDSLGTVDTPLCRRRPLTARLPSTSRRSQSRTPSPVAL